MMSALAGFSMTDGGGGGGGGGIQCVQMLEFSGHVLLE